MSVGDEEDSFHAIEDGTCIHVHSNLHSKYARSCCMSFVFNINIMLMKGQNIVMCMCSSTIDAGVVW